MELASRALCGRVSISVRVFVFMLGSSFLPWLWVWMLLDPLSPPAGSRLGWDTSGSFPKASLFGSGPRVVPHLTSHLVRGNSNKDDEDRKTHSLVTKTVSGFGSLGDLTLLSAVSGSSYSGLSN
jgi:hypothetical protein